MIALPELLLQRQEELDDNTFEIMDLLGENQLTKLPLATVVHWLAWSSCFQTWAEEKMILYQQPQKGWNGCILPPFHQILPAIQRENVLLELSLKQVKKREGIKQKMEEWLGYWNQDREFGFGYYISPEDLEKVNK
jgi:hypothetical protein